MLRIGFLPSDFHPILLMLGEAEDLRLLAATLRRFAHEQTEIAFDRLSFCAEGRTHLTLTAKPGSPGIQAGSDPAHFTWHLDPGHALHFAGLIDQLALPSCLAGSEILACSNREEIPVKISRGEYTDDFLLNAAG